MDTENRTEHIDIGHTRVAYDRTGSGPDLLFIHGWPLNGATWRNVVEALPDFTCHVIDLPGAGGSTATAATPLSLRGHIESVGRILDHLDLGSVSLIGHDSGGLVARNVAALRPDLVRSLVLSGTEIPHHDSLLLRVLVHGAALPGMPWLFRRALASPTLTRSPLLFGGTVADSTLLEGPFRRLFIDPLLTDDALWRSQLQVLTSLNFKDVDALEEIHGRLPMPTMLLWGEQDSFFPVHKARAMTAQFAGPTTFHSIADASLLVHEEHPREMAAMMRTFAGTMA